MPDIGVFIVHETKGRAIGRNDYVPVVTGFVARETQGRAIG